MIINYGLKVKRPCNLMDKVLVFETSYGGSIPSKGTHSNKLLSPLILCDIIGCMKKDYILFKKKAIKLRNKGLSYNEIKKEVPIAKSTLSLWLKSILLKPEHQKRLYTKQIQILSKGPQSQKSRREKEVEQIIKNAEKEIQIPIALKTYRLIGAVLYWAEGSKGKQFALTNSDPHLILFTIHWIEKILKIPTEKLKMRLNIYPQQNELKIKNFWSDLTGIPLKNFGKSYIKPANKNYKKNNLYYGTARIEIPKSTNIKYKIFGWIKAVLKEIETNVKLTEKKWECLKKTKRPVNLLK